MNAVPASATLQQRIASSASAAGLVIASTEPATSFSGAPTTRFSLVLKDAPGRALPLELSDSFEAATADASHQLQLFLAEIANRLRNPRPNAMLTLTGIPLSYSQFAWPFHESTAGADTSVVHGQINLEDGEGSPLHAKIAAALTVTLRETVPAPEQPFAESFILNAIRKTLDQGQLELVKSGNRQPVPVTTRFYSLKNKKFNFNDTNDTQRRNFLAAKTYWLSGVLGNGAPVWLLDPRDAQYLNSTVAELKLCAEALARDGLITPSYDPAYASPTAELLAKKPEFVAELNHALAFIKPSFNEEMRHGHTNM